jgi:hypothetical protein
MNIFLAVIISSALVILPPAKEKERRFRFRLSAAVHWAMRTGRPCGYRISRAGLIRATGQRGAAHAKGNLELEKAAPKIRGRGVVVLGISMDEGTSAAQRVKEFAGKYGLTYRMLMDNGKTSGTYGVRNIPATYLLDGNQFVVAMYPGYISGLGEKIADQIEKLLGK